EDLKKRWASAIPALGRGVGELSKQPFQAFNTVQDSGETPPPISQSTQPSPNVIKLVINHLIISFLCT
ncbi:MAG TPA: hypothetical protein VIJ27_05110, partial [Mucilaginibacter sp.]